MPQQHPNAQLFRSPSRHLLALAVVIAGAIFATGCEPQIGDACDGEQDCPSAATCDRSVEDGLCTIRDCRPGTCPSEAVCIEYARHEAFCMKSCEDDGDCRDGHQCIDDDHDARYCFIGD